MRPLRIEHQPGLQALITGVVTGNGSFEAFSLFDPVTLHCGDEDRFLVMNAL